MPFGSLVSLIPEQQPQYNALPPLHFARHAHTDSPTHAEGSEEDFQNNRHFSSPFPGRGQSHSKRVDSARGEVDEGYENYIVADRLQSLQPKEFLHFQNFHFQTAADIHGHCMKKKLDTICTLDTSPRSVPSPACRAQQIQQRNIRAPALREPVELAVRGCGDSGFPTRLSHDTSTISATSGRLASFRHILPLRVELRNGSSGDSPSQRHRNNSLEVLSSYARFGFAGVEDMDINGIPMRLRPDVVGGTKRRTTSLALATDSCGRPTEALRRQEMSSRLATARLQTKQGSASTTSPAALSRTDSGTPVDPSVAADSTVTSTSEDGAEKQDPVYICECCPKKAKIFHTVEQLFAHESEKLFECHYCTRRFKNKNEAERHQNSLHVRAHSWSCAALSSYDSAFYPSIDHPGEADSCAYCGVEFPRSGSAPVTRTGPYAGRLAPNYVTDEDWDARILHLKVVHKFRECNSSKKFYRADHFRQHLKHSHAGTSGKWTNVLENACMLPENQMPDETSTRRTQW
ncbi:hypothetical protein E4U57_008205 [Claviceps arundinis]|uniref:C2H2-type domain-containing protein n=1 Tax=Claviceps arundinis TaxID=1623583 RepID=A0ABQ7PDI1_9HYPO|nr:hypothetical protein E4U57_008205 [Claviceps arundinis]